MLKLQTVHITTSGEWSSSLRTEAIAMCDGVTQSLYFIACSCRKGTGLTSAQALAKEVLRQQS